MRGPGPASGFRAVRLAPGPEWCEVHPGRGARPMVAGRARF